MTKIRDLLAAGPTYSFEFMPPKTDEMLRRLEKCLRELEPLQPSFCSVTYGAGGSTRDRTLEAVLHIHRDTSMVAMPHLTCVGQTRDEIEGLLRTYHDDGIENVLALAGDPPLDGPATGDFTYAVELVDLVEEVGDFSICVAAFPECHPKSTDRKSDREWLATKLARADFGITQFFWSAEHYFRMRDELDALGVTTPVIPSLFPIVNVETAKRFTVTNGADWPDWLADRVERANGNADLRRIGVEVASEIGVELLAQDPPGLHIYALNRSDSASQIWENLGLSRRTA
jgi:methylenetetrahydrofolate reductase (NADPH)